FPRKSPPSSSTAVDHERGGLVEEGSECVGHVVGQGGRVQGLRHELHPTVAGRLIDGEWSMALAQARVAALLNIAIRPAKAADQEVPQARFRAGHVARWIHRPQNV